MASISDAHLIGLNRAATVARLLAGTAHEVNNALLVISGTAELLEDQTGAPEAVGKGLDRIRAQTGKAASAINDVLAFTRATGADRGRVNLRDAAASALALRAYAINRARLTGALTGNEAPAIVDGSRVLLQQAILNLIGNAEQALAGKPGGTIRLSLAVEQGQAVLRIADSGPGVPAADRDRIFEPFVSSGDPAVSSGLGLPAARRIAEMHGGTLTLEPSDNGAVFLLKIPVV